LRRQAVRALALLGLACGTGSPELVRWPEARPDAVLVRRVAVLDVEAGRVEQDRDVLIAEGRIAAIGIGGQLSAGAGGEVIDGRGATLLPGLIDSHAHVTLGRGPSWEFSLPDPEGNLRAYLYAGVTGVFDPGDSTPEAFERPTRVARGELLGPHLVTAGRVHTAPDGHPIAMVKQLTPWWLRWYLVPRVGVPLASPEEAREAVARRAERGGGFVKVVVDRIPLDAPRIDLAVLAALVEETHRRGMRSVAHIGSVEDALDAARAGADAWLHVVYKERLSDAAAAELASFGIPMVPTLVVWHALADLRDPPRQSTAIERESVPAEILDAFDHPPLDSPRIKTVFGPYLDLLDARQADWAGTVRRLHEAGVTILAGSDAQPGVFPGAGLHRELALLARAGLPPLEVVRAATLYPARFFAQSQDPPFGVVRVGKRADLVLVNGNPLERIAAISDLRGVILDGVPLLRIPVTAAGQDDPGARL
jgi:imidazolonepropionase-like amidohydrolase